ncbi:hypothetical protein OH492_18115 [Vibrio chagasii]|nr:hypothetical protein [Vibrio chagasii]
MVIFASKARIDFRQCGGYIFPRALSLLAPRPICFACTEWIEDAFNGKSHCTISVLDFSADIDFATDHGAI